AQVALDGRLDRARQLHGEVGQRPGVAALPEVREEVLQGGLAVRALRELDDQRLAQARRLVRVALRLCDLCGVEQREVTEGVSGGQERLQRRASAAQVAARDLRPRVQVPELVAMVEVRLALQQG